MQKTVDRRRRQVHPRLDANLSNDAAADRRRHPDQPGCQRPRPPGPGRQGRSCRRSSRRRKQQGIPVIAYDRLIEDPSVLYLTSTTRMSARPRRGHDEAKVPKGNYVLIKGDPGDPNASRSCPRAGQAGLKDKVASGDIKILGPPTARTPTPGRPTKAQNNMEAIIDAANAYGNKIDAVLAENDSTALGVVAALEGQVLRQRPGQRPGRRHGQPENVAAGHPVRGRLEERQRARQGRRCGRAAALQRQEDRRRQAPGRPRPHANAPAAGNKVQDFTTPGGNTVKSLILKVQPDHRRTTSSSSSIAKWLTKDVLCKNATDAANGAAASASSSHVVTR